MAAIGLLIYKHIVIPKFNTPVLSFWEMFFLIIFVRLFTIPIQDYTDDEKDKDKDDQK